MQTKETHRNRLQRILLVSLTLVCQWAVAITFLFSGFVKAADPMGMEHKLEAYLAAFSSYIPWYSGQPLAGTMYLDLPVIILAALEFLLGIYFLIGMHQKVTTALAAIFMTLLTVLTAYIFLYNPVPDCGCFGDAVVLTNGQTLGKNILLLVAVFWLLIGRRYMVRFLSRRNEWFTTSASFIYIIGLAVYSLRYLPLIDFTGYSIGTDIRTAMMGDYRTHFVYAKDGQQQELTDEDQLPDSTWTLVSSESEELVAPTIEDFSLLREDETDVAEDILEDKGYTFILTIPNFQNVDVGCSDQINDIYDFVVDNGLKMYCATALSKEEQGLWSDRTGAAYPFATSSSETLKSMVRSNPGLLLIHDGRIVAKWSNHGMPDDEALGQVVKLNGKATFPALDALVEKASDNSAYRTYLWLTFLYVALLLFVVLADRLWAGNKYYRRIQQARLWLSKSSPLAKYDDETDVSNSSNKTE